MNRVSIKLALAVVLSTIATYTLQAQTTQAGRIVEYNGDSSKTPSEGVEINIRNAATTTSDSDGRFILEFKTMRPGQHVNVNSIIKEGYEIFHLEAISQWNINPDEPFTIVMVNSTRFKEMCDKYHSTSSQSYRAQHEADLRNLEMERESGRITLERYEQERAELIANYEHRLNSLTDYINRFARIDLENLSTVEREIVTAIENGNIDQAIAMYEDQQLVHTFLTQVSQRDEELAAMNQSINNTYEAISRQILVYMLAGGKENFDKVFEIYELMLAKDPTNTLIASDYTSFLLQQGHYTRAIDIAHIILQSNPDDATYTTTCHEIACAYIYSNNYDQARKYAMEGLARCSEEETIYYSLQHDLSEVYLAHGDMDKVRATTQIILNSEYANAISISSAANTLGNLEFECGNWQEAIAAYSILIENSGNIALTGHDMIDKIESLRSLCAAYINIARCYTLLGDFVTAEEYYKEAVSTCNTLYNYNPEKYTVYKYSVHNHLGCMYNAIGDNAKALEEIKNAGYFIEILYKQSPEAFGPSYFENLNNLGYLCYIEKRYVESELYYDRAYEFISSAYSANPSADLKISCTILQINYTLLYNDMGKYDKAITHATTSVEYTDELYAIYGEGIRYQHGLAYRAYVIANHSLGNKREVKTAMERFEALYGESAELYNMHGEIALLSGNDKKAKKYYDMVLSIDPTFYIATPSPLNDKFCAQ